MPRVATLIVALVVSLLAIPSAPQIARADNNCPAPVPFAQGDGITSPYVISEPGHLQKLRDDSMTGWDDSYVVTANINMGGCSWNSTIGDPTVNQFTGRIDGDGHTISGLNITLAGYTSPMYGGLVGYLGFGGVITELGFTGSVTAASNNGNAQVIAGGLVGHAANGATISYSYASGAITTNLVSGSPSASGGGLVGKLDGGGVSNSYSTGGVLTTGTSGTMSVGGLIGELSAGTITKSYSSGGVTALATSATINKGGFIGARVGSTGVSDSLWDTTSSGTGTGVGGAGSTTGITGKNTGDMQTLSTYSSSAWAITGSWVPFSLPSDVWGICAGVTRAYLLWQDAANPCPTTPSAPTITSIIPGGTTASVAFTVDDTGNAALTRLDFAYDDTTAVDFTTNTVSSPATLTGLAQGTTYTVYMRVKNSTYTGPWSTPQTFTTLRPPGTPTIASVTPGLTSAQVAFTADDSGGSSITRLEFALDDTVTVDDSTTNIASPYTLGTLTSGTTYSVYVRAVNAQGTGPWSSPTVFTTLAPPPPPLPNPASAPRDVVVTAGTASLAATWQPPLSEGSFPVTQYKATASPGGRMCLTAATTCTIDGLTNGVAYTVIVQALSGAGWSASSEPSNAVIPRPSTVPSLTITGSRGSGVDRGMIRVRGTSTGLAGERATLWLSIGDRKATRASATVRIKDDGTFMWARKLNRAAVIYAEVGTTRSNTISIPAR